MSFGRVDSDKPYDLYALPAPPPAIEGLCADCGRGIPYGYLATVRRWGVKIWGSIRVATPEVMVCKDCAVPIAKDAWRKNMNKNKEEVAVLSMKEVAQKIEGHLGNENGVTSKGLAKVTGLGDEYVEAIRAVLKRMGSADMLELREGRWYRV